MSAAVSLSFVTWRTSDRVLNRFLCSVNEAIDALVQNMDGQVVVYAISNDGPQRASAMVAAVQRRQRPSDRVRWQILHGHGNLGYGAAQNLAIRRTQAACHFISNADLVLDRGALLHGVRFLREHPEVVAVGPQGTDAAGRYANLAKRQPTVLALLLRALSVQASQGFFGRRVGAYVYDDKLPSTKAEPVELLSGCFMACRTAAVQAVGGFDERYFLYFEDFDLCRRLAAQGGVCELPELKIRHDGGYTASRGLRRSFHFACSAVRFFHRYGWRLW